MTAGIEPFVPTACPTCGARYVRVEHRGRPGTIYGLPAHIIDLDHPTLVCGAGHEWPGRAQS